MWGNLLLEASHQQNFNVGFSTLGSKTLIYIAQWQYWWWFWFAFLWCFYYLLILRTIRRRMLKMYPKLHTNYRPHSKWGDFLVCIVPVSWCINILINSNLVLRLLEWQNESSLFTIRIRGRQWYWIYKFDLKNFTDIFSAPKNIGSNKWVSSTPNDLQVANDYLHVLQLRLQSKWTGKYWQTELLKHQLQKKKTLITPQEKLRSDLAMLHQYNLFNTSIESFLPSSLKFSNLNSFISPKSTQICWNDLTHSFSNFPNFSSGKIFKNISIDSLIWNFFKKPTNSLWLNMLTNTSKSNIVHFNQEVLENTRWVKRSDGVALPFRLLKNLLNETQESQYSVFDTRFGDSDSIAPKPQPHTKYITLKQERLKRRKKNITHTLPLALTSSQLEVSKESLSSMQYKLIQENKSYGDLITVTLARRLLRTKRVLVVPAHVNITAITNSYDVVHSWFLPSLGLKFDCVPGRSTHHTFFIENVGFYYGQCAEICGRYHHHMPIRLCALPFEHFLIWWQTFGLSKIILHENKSKNSSYNFIKYQW